KQIFSGEPEENTFRFCFVRNPLTWYESFWRFKVSIGWEPDGDELDKWDWHPNSMLNGLGDDDFNQFVRNVTKKRPGYVTELYGWYTKTGIHFVGKQEDLVDGLIKVLRVLNLNFDEDFVRNFEPQNTSDYAKYPVAWDKALRKDVERLEYAGIVRYGYERMVDEAIAVTAP
ncbi:unnamed protein product, partial [marine sediment metagenome]